MSIKGVDIYTEGFKMGHDQELQLKSLLLNLRAMLPISELRLRFVKNKRFIEGMIWCQTLGIPIGAYNRSYSFSQLTKTLLKKISKECRRVHKLNSVKSRSSLNHMPASDPCYDLAG